MPARGRFPEIAECQKKTVLIYSVNKSSAPEHDRTCSGPYEQSAEVPSDGACSHDRDTWPVFYLRHVMVTVEFSSKQPDILHARQVWTCRVYLKQRAGRVIAGCWGRKAQ